MQSTQTQMAYSPMRHSEPFTSLNTFHLPTSKSDLDRIRPKPTNRRLSATLKAKIEDTVGADWTYPLRAPSPPPNTPLKGPVQKALSPFDLTDGIYVVTGGSQGLGLSMAIGIAEAGGTVYCLDVASEPSADFRKGQFNISRQERSGTLSFRSVNVVDAEALDATMASIANHHHRLDGVIAAAGINRVSPALDTTRKDAAQLLDVNLMGVFQTATSAARQMLKHNQHHPTGNRGSIVLIASMSGMIANKGLQCSMYNASKAAVIQLAKNLAMEWSRIQQNGSGGIRINTISPGHTVTPMVLGNFKQQPGLREEWERENMMGRLAAPEEFKGAGVFLLSQASSFMTGSNMVIDGGHTAW